jgi:hypothetical protein
MKTNIYPPKDENVFVTTLYFSRRKETMTKQGYRCAGCGMRIDPGKLYKSISGTVEGIFEL